MAVTKPKPKAVRARRKNIVNTPIGQWILHGLECEDCRNHNPKSRACNDRFMKAVNEWFDQDPERRSLIMSAMIACLLYTSPSPRDRG